MKTNVVLHKNILILLAALTTIVCGIFTGYYLDTEKLNIYLNEEILFGGVLIFCIIILFGSYLSDVLAVKNHKKSKSSEYIYQIFDQNIFQMKFFIVTLSLLSLYLMVRYITSLKLSDLFLFLIIILDTVFLSYQTLSKNELLDIGLIFRGQYYHWNKVKSYQWENDGNTIVFNYMRRLLFFKYNQEIKCSVIPEQKKEIAEFLRKQLEN